MRWSKSVQRGGTAEWSRSRRCPLCPTPLYPSRTAPRWVTLCDLPSLTPRVPSERLKDRNATGAGAAAGRGSEGDGRWVGGRAGGGEEHSRYEGCRPWMYSTWAGERRTRGEAYRTMALTYGTGGGTAGASAAPGNGVAATEGGGGTAEAASEANGRCDDDVGSGTSAARSQQDVDAHARTQLAEAVTVLLSGLGEDPTREGLRETPQVPSRTHHTLSHAHPPHCVHTRCAWLHCQLSLSHAIRGQGDLPSTREGSALEQPSVTSHHAQSSAAARVAAEPARVGGGADGVVLVRGRGWPRRCSTRRVGTA